MGALVRMLWSAIACLVCAPSAYAAQPPIQPGGLVLYPNDQGRCTAGFVFDGTGPLVGRVFVGTAAHCFHDAGQEVVDAEGTRIGQVVATRWPLDTVADDWGFIEIDADDHHRVTPEVAGNPSLPRGVFSGAAATGDAVRISGHGTGFSEDSSLREQREGRLRAVEEPFYELFGPISFGDSGGPLVHLESGGALGVVSSYCGPFGVVDGVAACVVYGPTITHVLAEANSAGFPLRMRSAGESAPALSAPPPPSPAQPAGTPTPAPAPDSRPAPTGKRKSKSRAARRAACRRSTRRLKGAKRKRALRRCARLR